MAPKTPTQTKVSTVDKALRGMFRRLEARPAPDHIMSIVDQLEAAEQQPVKKKSAGGG